MKFVDATLADIGEPREWLSFDDVLLMPFFSPFVSRNDIRINTSTRFTTHYDGKIPIISANMDSVTESRMATTLQQYGGLGILHRFYQERGKDFFLDEVRKVSEKGFVSFSIGANTDLDIIKEILQITSKVIVCLDVANAFSYPALQQLRNLRKEFGKSIDIIAGNVSTFEGASALLAQDVDAIKVGQGNGSHCTTRLVTGHGVPQLSAIINCRKAINAYRSNCALISDGGIRKSGDIVKALCAGADSVMIGFLFAGTNESAGEYFEVSPGEKAKRYRGQSSRHFLEDIGKKGVTPEGIDQVIMDRGSVVPILEELIGGLRSGMSYAGVSNLKELYDKATFMKISYASQIESLPHGLYK